jgi:glycine receptor alpha-2/glycine receptor alpha-3
MMLTIFSLLFLTSICKSQIYAPVYIPNWSFEELIPAEYDKSQPPIITKPSGQLQPVVILITVNVTQLTRVDASEQTFTVDIVYSQRWRDHRLNLPPPGSGVKTIPLGPAIRKKLWIPDVFVGNSVKPIMLIMTPLFMEIDMDTRSLIATSRQVVELRCPMDLYHFPLDEQICPIEFTLLRNPRDRVFLRFENTHSSRIDFSNYYIIQSMAKGLEECISIRGPSYSCVAAKLELFRKFSYYLIRIYSPSFLLVVTSFVGFWVPPMGHSARTALIVTPLLALITQQTMISQEVNVSYLVAIHIWSV